MAGKQELAPRWTSLDRDRAASMADEGGASGAHVETQGVPLPLYRAHAQRSKWLRVLGWSALVAGCGALARWLLLRRRRA